MFEEVKAVLCIRIWIDFVRLDPDQGEQKMIPKIEKSGEKIAIFNIKLGFFIQL